MQTENQQNPYLRSLAMLLAMFAISCLMLAINIILAPVFSSVKADDYSMCKLAGGHDKAIFQPREEAVETIETPEPEIDDAVLYYVEPDPLPDVSDTLEVLAYEAAFPTEYDKQYVLSAAEAYGVDVEIVLGICFHETAFTPDLIGENENGTRDWGIAQCNDTTLGYLTKTLGITDMSELLQRDMGIRACCSLLAYYKDMGLSGDDLLLAYQQGYNGYLSVKEGTRQPWAAYEETRECVDVFREYTTQNS